MPVMTLVWCNQVMEQKGTDHHGYAEWIRGDQRHYTYFVCNLECDGSCNATDADRWSVPHATAPMHTALQVMCYLWRPFVGLTALLPHSMPHSLCDYGTYQLGTPVEPYARHLHPHHLEHPFGHPQCPCLHPLKLYVAPPSP